jgi:putative capsular polysaccharide biosythesis protein
MWPFKKKYALVDSKIFQGFTDWHSHILPGVDDGVQTMQEALDILALYERLGVKAVWLTPHIMEDVPNTTAYLKERFENLKAAYQGNVVLHLAAEYMLDNLFCERLNNSDLLPLGEKGDWLLVETSFYNPPMNLPEILGRIKAKGFHPVLAHPERYIYMSDSDYGKLKQESVRFQINLPSLAGFYGREAQRKAKWLLAKGYTNLYGTDTHCKYQFSSFIELSDHRLYSKCRDNGFCKGKHSS